MPNSSFPQRLQSVLTVLENVAPPERSFEELLRHVVAEAGGFYGSLLTVEKGGRIQVRAVLGENWDSAKIGILKMTFEGARGLIDSGEEDVLYIEDAAGDSSFVEIFEGTGSELFLPVGRDEDGLGLLQIGSREKAAFDDSLLERLQAMAAVVSMGLRQDAERKRHLQARRDLLRAERDAWASKVLRGLAHEINSPLTGILGQCSILGSEIGSPETRAMVQQMQKSIERTGRFVSKLNGYGVTLVDRLDLEGEEEEIGHLLEDFIGGMTSELAEQGVELENGLMEELPAVRFGRGKLERILGNLLDNATRAVREMHGRKGGRIRIESAYPRTGIIRIAVHDNGCGMDAKEVHSAFEPFFKGGKGSVPHRGMGLWLARETLREQEGHIWCESTKGEGTTVLIELPVASLEGRNLEVIEEQAEEQRNEMRRSRTRKEGLFEVIETEPDDHHEVSGGLKRLSLRVLIVDDEHYIREILGAFFKACDCTVATAEDGMAGLRMAVEEEFDIIISDIRMPKMTGMEFYHALIHEKPDFNGQFVFISGELMTNDYREEVMETDRPFLIKPFLPEDILNVVPVTPRG
ncbi:MAG: ATP-binding protein [Verrucomicrobiota bacterium]